MKAKFIYDVLIDFKMASLTYLGKIEIKEAFFFMLKVISIACLLFFLPLANSCKGQNRTSKDPFLNGNQVLRISASDDPSGLDPRLARDLSSTTLMHLLYEGLMSLDFRGNPHKALCEEVTIAPDLKTYSFKLKKSIWSNGDPLTAEDFVRTWKQTLDPDFLAPNAHQLFVIKGAKEAKNGELSLDKIGISALDAHTLVVELENPSSYFLDLVSTHFFYPVHPESTLEKPITNGPFVLRSWKRHNELTVKKNPHYWDVDEVHLEGVAILVLDEQTALRLFENKELDWVGSPMGTLPQDALVSLKKQHRLHIVPAAGTHFFRFNTKVSPFTNVHMRKAFTLALNRKNLVTHVTQGNQLPALSLVPPSFKLEAPSTLIDDDTPQAWFSFQQALEELKLSKDELPPITLSYASNERNHKIAQAVQQQWKKTLGIDVKLESMEPRLFFDKLSNQNYLLASGSWYADIRDPINFLEVFKFKDNATNNTGWENAGYISLLDESSAESDPGKRLTQLSDAQKILMDEVPISPIFFGAFNYVKDEKLLGVHFFDLGYIDCKYAFFGD